MASTVIGMTLSAINCSGNHGSCSISSGTCEPSQDTLPKTIKPASRKASSTHADVLQNPHGRGSGAAATGAVPAASGACVSSIDRAPECALLEGDFAVAGP